MPNKTFLLKSTKNKSFGTAFCVHTDEQGAFLLTCTHVVEACEIDALEVEGHEAKLLHIGSSKDIDLAVVYVEGLKEAKALALLETMQERETPFSLDGFKVHKDGTKLQRPLSGVIQNISKIHNENKIVTTYELQIEGAYSIERGYSGSALLCESTGQVLGVATDKNSNGKQAYAIPIKYLKEIWTEMPEHLWFSESETKNNFSQEVFEHLDTNPLLLFSTDAYNHTDYIENIRAEAKERFGSEYILEINCGRFANFDNADKFFTRLAQKLKFADEVADSIDFEDAIIDKLEALEPLKLFILVLGFERLQEDVRNAFAVTLRNLQEEYAKCFNLVLFGGEKLIQLKYSTGIHSYFNTFEQKLIPSPSFAEWKARFEYLTAKSYEDTISVTGGYQKLTEYCFKEGATCAKTAQKCLEESSWKSELFRLYRNDKLCLLFDKTSLGDAHPYSDNELLYRLYWDNLIVEEKGQFVWRSAFLVGLGKDVLACE